MKKFNEKKYTAAIKTVAEQVIAMVDEDYSEDDDAIEIEIAEEDYAGAAVQQILEAIKEVRASQ